MRITKVTIENFKCYKGKFSLPLNPGVNILVGNNEAGKSTILEAIHLALTGILNGRYIKNELSQYLFNQTVERQYIESLETKSGQELPRIFIELFLTAEKDEALAELRGNGNREKINDCGISFCIEFDEQYKKEYDELLNTHKIKTIPIEYYKVTWRSFARAAVTARSIPIKSVLIDSSSVRTQNGSDLYISRIIRENLEDKERVEISQAHRHMKEFFMDTPSVKAINKKLNLASITEKKVKISVDLATQNAWEMSLMTYLDEIPFHYVGKGEQSVVKTTLALSHQKSQEANIILLEEPENHLSHTKLNKLISGISRRLEDKQIIISTHSSFVANKLGLDSVIFLNNLKSTRLNELSTDTKDFFKKLAGYDTLRLILCNKALLVEGASDELIIQKAYMVNNQGKLPIEDGIDVISVGTSFLRFLEIAEKINKSVAVITDNDGNMEALKKKYENYLGNNANPSIKICFDPSIHNGNMENFNYNTLEPNLLKSNNRDLLNQIFNTKYQSDTDLLKFMKEHKTSCALKIFDTQESVKFPQYILDAIA